MLDYNLVKEEAKAQARALSDCWLATQETLGRAPTKQEVAESLPPKHTKAMYRERCSTLLQSLPPLQRMTLIENMQPLSHSWMQVIPLNQSLTLSNLQVQAGLAIRLLFNAETAITCSRCGQHADFLHADVCELRRQQPSVDRHNAVRDFLASVCKLKRSRVQVEAHADRHGANPQLRADLRVQGPAALDGVAGNMDVSFVACRTQHNRAIALRQQQVDGESTQQFVTRCLNIILERRDHEKESKYAGQFSHPFLPITFSTGGACSPAAVLWLKHLGILGARSKQLRLELSILIVKMRSPA